AFTASVSGCSKTVRSKVATQGWADFGTWLSRFLRDGIDLEELRRMAQEAGLDPDEVVSGYEKLRDSQLSPEDVLKRLGRAVITD
ncbi:hypothetical protein, partial [Streptomyces regalis]|uniref:hypothetical protein n=1 Tax=Streptomyces regalis TaxID=68262 RepID=UPI000AE598E7